MSSEYSSTSNKKRKLAVKLLTDLPADCLRETIPYLTHIDFLNVMLSCKYVRNCVLESRGYALSCTRNIIFPVFRTPPLGEGISLDYVTNVQVRNPSITNDQVAKFMSMFANLRNLDVSYCRGLTDDAFAAVRSEDSLLKELNISNSGCFSVQTFSKFPCLETLFSVHSKINNSSYGFTNQLSGNTFKDLKLLNLKVLILKHVKILNIFKLISRTIERLEILSDDCIRVIDTTCTSTLNSFNNVKYLRLTGSRIDDKDFFKSLTKIEILKLFECSGLSNQMFNSEPLKYLRELCLVNRKSTLKLTPLIFHYLSSLKILQIDGVNNHVVLKGLNTDSPSFVTDESILFRCCGKPQTSKTLEVKSCIHCYQKHIYCDVCVEKSCKARTLECELCQRTLCCELYNEEEVYGDDVWAKDFSIIFGSRKCSTCGKVMCCTCVKKIELCRCLWQIEEYSADWGEPMRYIRCPVCISRQICATDGCKTPICGDECYGEWGGEETCKITCVSCSGEFCSDCVAELRGDNCKEMASWGEPHNYCIECDKSRKTCLHCNDVRCSHCDTDCSVCETKSCGNCSLRCDNCILNTTISCHDCSLQNNKDLCPCVDFLCIVCRDKGVEICPVCSRGSCFNNRVHDGFSDRHCDECKELLRCYRCVSLSSKEEKQIKSLCKSICWGCEKEFCEDCKSDHHFKCIVCEDIECPGKSEFGCDDCSGVMCGSCWRLGGGSDSKLAEGVVYCVICEKHLCQNCCSIDHHRKCLNSYPEERSSSCECGECQGQIKIGESPGFVCEFCEKIECVDCWEKRTEKNDTKCVSCLKEYCSSCSKLSHFMKKCSWCGNTQCEFSPSHKHTGVDCKECSNFSCGKCGTFCDCPDKKKHLVKGKSIIFHCSKCKGLRLGGTEEEFRKIHSKCIN